MNVHVRKIANGYIISYEPPKKVGEKKVPSSPQEMLEMLMAQANQGGSLNTGVQEWYCATKPQVEEAVRRIVAENFAFESLTKSEDFA